eukprot:scaffold1527_cov143-Pinguiococcus_pyrenoidosus.AAC.6
MRWFRILARLRCHASCAYRCSLSKGAEVANSAFLSGKIGNRPHRNCRTWFGRGRRVAKITCAVESAPPEAILGWKDTFFGPPGAGCCRSNCSPCL